MKVAPTGECVRRRFVLWLRVEGWQEDKGGRGQEGLFLRVDVFFRQEGLFLQAGCLGWQEAGSGWYGRDWGRERGDTEFLGQSLVFCEPGHQWLARKHSACRPLVALAAID